MLVFESSVSIAGKRVAYTQFAPTEIGLCASVRYEV